jgi:hypothetical protein
MRQINCRVTQDTKIVNSVFPVRIGESKTIALLALSQHLLAAFEIFEKCNVVCFTYHLLHVTYKAFFPHDATAPSEPEPPRYRGFTITLRHTTTGRTPLDE